MSSPTVVVEAKFTEAGGEHLARHLRDRPEGAVISELADLRAYPCRAVASRAR
jgi:hypothetical protein